MVGRSGREGPHPSCRSHEAHSRHGCAASAGGHAIRMIACTALTIVVTAVFAQKIGTGNVDPAVVPSRDLKFEQKLNAQLPLHASFVDNKGNDVTLGDYVGDKPIVMALIYYKCPSLC